MNSQPYFRRCLILLCLVAASLGLQPSGLATPTNVFFTQFETSEGYNTVSNLVGQNSWNGEGSGGNGIIVVTNLSGAQTLQAYVGFNEPTVPGDDSLYVWRPINFNPIAAGLPIVKFSVLMQIADSTNGKWDFFGWTVYNTNGNRLFSIDFDNLPLTVNYQLNGNSPWVTNQATYFPNQDYLFSVTMNFASNLWSAHLDNVLIISNQAISTISVPLNLGDVDAVWFIGETDAPGDNFMLFDNYLITAEALTVPPVPSAQVQFLGRTPQGWALLETFVTNGPRWSLDATTNFVNWTPLVTNSIDSGSFPHIDKSAAPFARRYYRARLVP